MKVLDTTFLVDVLQNVPAAIEKLRTLEAEGALAAGAEALVTRNPSDVRRIEGLRVETY